MADNQSDYNERRSLNAALPNSGTYLALMTTGPNDAGTGGVEVSGGGYARLPLAVADAATNAAGATTKVNTADLTSAVATADWGAIPVVAVYDAATGGNLLWHVELTADYTFTIRKNMQWAMPAGQLVFAQT